MKPLLLALALLTLCARSGLAQSPPNDAASKSGDALIPWLLRDDTQLSGLPFAEVIHAATGHKVLPLDRQDEVDRRVLQELAVVLDKVVRHLNAVDSKIQSIPRINEVSSHIENILRQFIDASPGLSCDFPRTAKGRVQRSGYPDLRILDESSRRIFYLDPKLYAAGSRESSFRTFYFEPKKSTNKVLDDAVHLVAGFEHAPRTEGCWKFTRWDLIDLAYFKVKLKAEFQGSNRDLYRSDAIVATSAK